MGTGNSLPMVPHSPEDRKSKSGREEEIARRFEGFWDAFPKRVARGAAIAAFSKAVRAGIDPDDIVAGARRYARDRTGQDPRYTKHPATWLNSACWDDEPAAPTTGPGPVTIDGDGNLVPDAPVASHDFAPRRRMSRVEEMLSGVSSEWLADIEARRIARGR